MSSFKSYKPDDHDTRCFTTRRFAPNAGFAIVPPIHDALSFVPPEADPSFPYFGRKIEVDGRLVEIWSVNSQQIAFYPGKPVSDFVLGMEPNPEDRRIDGRYGRFDFIVCPQHYQTAKPWLSFILRDDVAINHGHNYPEFQEPYNVWNCAARPAYDRGHIQPAFITALSQRASSIAHRASSIIKDCYVWPGFVERRPWGPTPTDFDDLAAIRHYEDAVDRIVSIEREIRELDAWVRMGEIIQEKGVDWKRYGEFHGPVAYSSANDETLMGCWINGAPVDDAMWLWHVARVPCFIIHEILRADEMSPQFEGLTNIHTWSSFVVGTYIDIFERDHFYGYTSVATRMKTDLKQLRSVAMERLAAIPETLAEHRWNSSSLTISRVWASYAKIQSRSAPTVLPDEGGIHGFRDLNSIVLDPLRHPWIRPPPVKVYRGFTKFAHYYEMPSDDFLRSVMILFKKNPEWEGETWYDRHHGRILHFDDEETIGELPVGYTSDVKIFGRPAPRIRAYGTNAQTDANQRRPSFWMYKDATVADASQENLTDVAPPLSSLPLLVPEDGNSLAAAQRDASPSLAALPLREATPDPLPEKDTLLAADQRDEESSVVASPMRVSPAPVPEVVAVEFLETVKTIVMPTPVLPSTTETPALVPQASSPPIKDPVIPPTQSSLGVPPATSITLSAETPCPPRRLEKTPEPDEPMGPDSYVAEPYDDRMEGPDDAARPELVEDIWDARRMVIPYFRDTFGPETFSTFLYFEDVGLDVSFRDFRWALARGLDMMGDTERANILQIVSTPIVRGNTVAATAFWVRAASLEDSLKIRGALDRKRSSDGVTFDIWCVSEEEYMNALTHSHESMWDLDDEPLDPNDPPYVDRQTLSSRLGVSDGGIQNSLLSRVNVGLGERLSNESRSLVPSKRPPSPSSSIRHPSRRQTFGPDPSEAGPSSADPARVKTPRGRRAGRKIQQFRKQDEERDRRRREGGM